MEIPPKGWGAVEILIHEYRTELERLGWEVQIVNTRDKGAIVEEVNGFGPDFVHCQYDEHIDVMHLLSCPSKAITSHFGYLEQVWRFPDYYKNLHSRIIAAEDVKIFALSPAIADVYRSGGVSDERLFVVPNGVHVDHFLFKKTPELAERSIYLAKIDYRKRQGLIQPMQGGVDFAGNLCPHTALTSGFNPELPDYLGEWTKETLYSRMTDYANLVLLSDGEAHPLVCMEAMAAGLGLVISECATANLDLSKPFIDVIPEFRLQDSNYVREVISANRTKSLTCREEIRQYAREFDWENVIGDYDRLVRELCRRDAAAMAAPAPQESEPRNERIAIVTIATGQYFDLYFLEFQQSVLSTMAPAHDVTIFCFTDHVGVAMPHVELVHSEFLGWPFDTLMRFELISGILDRLSKYDFVMYLDADMKVVQSFDPKYFKEPFVAVTHPGFLGKTNEGTFEVDRLSAAHVEIKDRGTYVQGCVFGGRFASFRYMIQSLRTKVAEDLFKGDIPVWHDESFLNWFFSRHETVLLPASYAYPEGWNLDFEPVIIHRIKQHFAVRGTLDEPMRVEAVMEKSAQNMEFFQKLYLKSHEKVQRLEIRVLESENEVRKLEEIGSQHESALAEMDRLKAMFDRTEARLSEIHAHFTEALARVDGRTSLVLAQLTGLDSKLIDTERRLGELGNRFNVLERYSLFYRGIRALRRLLGRVYRAIRSR